MKTLALILTLFVSTFCYATENTKALLIFSADWCPSCRNAHKDIDNDADLIEAIKQYDIISLDFDRDKDLVRGYKIKTIPTFIIFENGKEVKRQVGYRNSKQLYRFLK